MNFRLKGITDASTIEQAQRCSVFEYDFDLRPRSLNFIQLKNVDKIISQFPHTKFQLIFENETNFTINEIAKKLNHSKELFGIEVCGNINFEEVDELKLDYSWRFQEDSQFSDIKRAKNLKKIILTHTSLEHYLESGELFGFLQLFNDENFKDIEFELLLDWDTNLIESALKQLNFSFVSFEVNSKVELSYQIPNNDLITSELERYHKIFN